MKFLCICQYGHSRSVALTRVLHGRGHSAVAIGYQTCGSAIGPLSEWADRIFVLEASYVRHVPEQYRAKVTPVDVGRDRWSNPYSHELRDVLHKLLETVLPDNPQLLANPQLADLATSFEIEQARDDHFQTELQRTLRDIDAEST